MEEVLQPDLCVIGANAKPESAIYINTLQDIAVCVSAPCHCLKDMLASQ